jgi:hypothetical protein
MARAMARTKQAKKKRVLGSAKRPASRPRTAKKAHRSLNNDARKSRVNETRRGKRSATPKKTQKRDRKAVAAFRRTYAPLPINDNQLILWIQGAVRHEVREVLGRVIRLLDDSDIGVECDAAMPIELEVMQTPATAELPSNRNTNKCDEHEAQHVAVEPVAETVPTAEEQLEVVAIGDEQSAAAESADDRAARMMIERIEAASIVSSPYTQSIVLSFLFDKGAFDSHSAVPTKDLPVKDSRRRKRLISELFEVGALQEVDVVPLRPKNADTPRPSGKRVNSVCLTQRAQRGWQLRHETRPNARA